MCLKLRYIQNKFAMSCSKVDILVSTTMRCGSTWVAKMLSGGKGMPLYVDGTVHGYDYSTSEGQGDLEGMAGSLETGRGSVMKTHDVPVRVMDEVLGRLPWLTIVISAELRQIGRAHV